MTEKEAKELYGKLDEIFGGKLVYEPFTFPTYPVDYIKYTEQPFIITTTGTTGLKFDEDGFKI